jgi:energy-converting hydrogenase Eha subunit E
MFFSGAQVVVIGGLRAAVGHGIGDPSTMRAG